MSTSRARLALVLAILLGLLSGTLTLASPVAAADRPTAEPISESAAAAAAAPGSFTWAMAPRFGADADNDHLIDMIDLESPPTAAEPTSWQIDFDACAGGAPADATYSWTFGSEAPTAPSAACTISHDFAQVDRTYDVTLTVASAAGTTTTTQTILPRDYVIVIMGDSASSGEGNPDWLDPDWTRTGFGNAVFQPKWNNEQCHRSALSGPAQAALRLEQRDPHSSITFVHVGCSGARITRGLLNPYQGIVNSEHPRLDCDDPTSPFYIKYPDPAYDAPTPDATGCLPSQVDQVKTILPHRQIDAVSILAGINDVFFSKVIFACLMENDCSTEHSTVLRDPDNRLMTSPEFIGVRFAQLQDRYTALFDTVMGQFNFRQADPALGIPAGHVFLGEYPNATQAPDGTPCTSNEKTIVDETAPSWVRDSVRVFLQGLAMEPDTGIIDGTEWGWAKTALIERLITETDTAVNAANAKWPGRFTKVSGSTHAFDQHGYCAKDTWFRSVGGSFLYQRDPEGSFHPNRAGHFFAYALPLEAQLADQLGITAPALPPHVPGDTEAIEAISQAWAPFLEVLGRTNVIEELDKIFPIKPGLPSKKGTDWGAVLNGVAGVTKGVLEHVGNTVAAHSLSDLDVWLDDPDGINGPLDDGRIGDVVIDIEGTISPHTLTSQYEVVLHVKAHGPASQLTWSTAGLRLDGGGSNLDIDWPLRFMVRPGDPLNAAYLDVSGTPGLTIALSAEQELPESAPATAQLGPIDVIAHGPAGGKAVDIETGLSLNVTDPDGDGKLTIEEMTGAAFTSLLTVTCAPGSHVDVDVALAGGLPGLTGDLAHLQLHDTNVCDGISAPSIEFVNPDLAGIQQLGLRDAVDAFSALAAALDRLQAAGRINLPFTSAQLADAVALAAKIRDVTEDPAAAAGLSLQSVVAQVEQSLGLPAGAFQLRFDVPTKRFLIDLDVDVAGEATMPLDAGVLDAAGIVDAATTGTVTVGASGHAHLGLAIDTTADPEGTPTDQLRSMSDRLLISTDSSLTLDGSASVAATVEARVGFVPVELTLDDGNGQPQQLLAKPDPAQPLARLDLDGPGAYVSVADLLAGDPARASVTAALNASLAPTTVRARALLGATELGHGTLTVAWPDLSQLTGPGGPQVNADAAFSQQVLTFAETANDPVALIGILLGGVRDGAAAVADIARRDEQLARSLPLVGSNYDDVVAGFAAVAKAADDLAALHQQLTLPQLEAALEQAIATALNVPVAGVADKITLGLEPTADGGGIGLGLHLNLCQASAVSDACASARPVGGTFGFDAAGLPVVAARGQASVALDYLASLRLDLVLQLPAVALGDATNPLPHVVDGQPAPALYVLGSTGVDATIGADVAGTVAATVGPYAVSLGITGTKGGAPFADPADAHVRMHFQVGTGGPADQRLTITDYIAAVVANLQANGVTSEVSGPCPSASQQGCADLPLYFKTTAGDVTAPDGSKWVQLGTEPITFRAERLLDPTTFQVVVPPEIGTDLANRAMSLSSVLMAIQYLIDQLRAAADGVNVDQSLPIVGKAYAAGSALLADLDALLAKLQALAAVIDAQTTAGNVRTQLQSWLYNNLGPSGLKLVLDANGSGTVTIDDVAVTVLCGQDACAATAPVTDITDVQLAVPLGRVSSATSPKIDFGVPGLKIVSDSTASASVGWHIDLAVGIDRSGVYVLTDGIGGRPEAGIDVKASLPDALNATIAGLPIAVTDLHSGQDVDLSLGVDLKGTAGQRKRLTELVPNLNDRAAIGFTIKGCADLDWAFEVRVPGVADPDALPAITGEIALHADWAGCAGSTGAPRDLRDGIAPVGSAQLKNVQLDIGKTASRTVGKVLGQLQRATSPLQPAINRITSPIPVVSDLARLVPGGPDELTWLDAWKASQDVSGNDVSGIVSLVNLTDFINSYNPNTAPNVSVPIVDDLTIDLAAAGRSYADPDQALDALIVGTPVVKDVLAEAEAAGWTIQSDLQEVVGESRAAEFTFPVLEKPSTLLQMLFGKDVDIAVFDAGTLHAGDGFDFFFGLPFAKVGIRGEASVDGHFAISYDTAGIRRALATKPLKWSSLGALVHGLGLNDLDASGNDVPEIRFDASLAAYAYAGVPGANVEVSGGVRGYVQADLIDPDGDGKVRYEEIAKRIRNPRCFFATEGSIEAFLQLKGQLGPFTGTKDIVDPYTLLAFDSVEDWCRQAESTGGGAEPVPAPVLASPTTPAGYWYLNIGNRAAQRNIGGGVDENVTLIDLGDGRVRVSMFGADQVIGSPTEPVIEISAIALDGNDQLHVEGPTGPGDTNVRIVFQGNNGDDVIEGGKGDDRLDGGPGTDRILGRDGNDSLTAGDGDDVVKGGNGRDTILGDGTLAGAGNDVIEGGDGDDIISPMWGADTVDGGAGNDNINGSNTFVSGGPATGPDRIDGGDGADTLWGSSDADVIIGGIGGTAIGGIVDRIDGRAGNDCILGDTGEIAVVDGVCRIVADETTGENDNLLGGNGADTIHAGAGNDRADGNSDSGSDLDPDTVSGGIGDDVVLGGGGNDALFGNDGTDTVDGQDGDDTLSGGEAGDTLRGGRGADRITGDAGDDTIWGDAGATAAVDGGDIVDGGAGDDTITGGPADDWLAGGDGTDSVKGEDGADQTFGGPGVDTVEGNLGNDVVRGGAGDDRISGGGGDDVVDGGEGNDLVGGGIITYTTLTPATWPSGAQHVAANFDITAGGSDTVTGGPGDDFEYDVDLTPPSAASQGGARFTVTDPADHGTTGISATHFTYTPATGYKGDDAFSYTLTLNGLPAGSGTATIANGANRPPVAVDDAVTTDQARPVLGSVLANDSDPDGDTLSVAAGSGTTANGGQWSIGTGGAFTYTPSAAFAGTDSFTYTVDDGHGASADATVVVTVRADVVPPAVYCPGVEGWSATEVSVTCEATDGGTGIAGEASFTLTTSTGPGNEGLFALDPPAVCDVAGNCTDLPAFAVFVDRKGPAITSSTDGASYVQGSAATLDLSCSDAGSGLAAGACAESGSPLDTASVGDRTVTVTAADNVGNTSTAVIAYVVTAVPDATAPDVTCPAPTGWSATEVTVSCTATDTGSGLADASQASFALTSATGAGNEGMFALDPPTVCDVAGNCTDLPAFAVFVDRKGPAITSSTAGASYVQGSSATLDLSCTDAGSGLATGACGEAGAPLDTATIGDHTVTVTAADNVGNTSALSIDYVVTPAPDVVAPDVTCPAPAGWSATEVTVSCTATDTGSGLADAGQASFTMTTAIGVGREGAYPLDPPAVCDAAGNCTDLPAFTVNVDRRVPTVTSLNNGRTYQQGAAVALDLLCSDEGSGLAAGACAEAGSALDTSTPGVHVLTIAAADNVGNTGSYTIAYTVTAPPPTVPGVSVGDVRVNEGNRGWTTVSVPLTLSRPSSTPVRVRYRVSLGTASLGDVRLPFGIQTVTFAAGTTQATVRLSVRGDRRREPNETVLVTITTATGASITRSVGTVTIVNDD